MKQKTTKTCRDEDCDNVFKLFRTTDKFCSPACALKNTPDQKPRTRIRQVSKKTQIQKGIYLKLRDVFIKKPENKFCAVYPHKPATEVHHKKGRIGKLLLYVPFWLAVSRDGHIWIHDNPKEAYGKGFLIKSSSL